MVQLPGRETRLRETALTEMAPIVELLAGSLRTRLDKPFAFFGHSMGAMVSFEVARRLRRINGIQPDYLFVSGRRAPQLPISEPVTYNLADREFLMEVSRLNGIPREALENQELVQFMPPVAARGLHGLPDVSLCPRGAAAMLDRGVWRIGRRGRRP